MSARPGPRRHPGSPPHRLAVAMWIPLLLLACGPATAGEPSNGERLYRQYCEGCHGPEGHGDGPIGQFLPERPRDLRDGVLARYDADTLVRRVLDGRALPLALDPEALRRRITDVDGLLAHVERLARSDPDTIVRGAELWMERCAECHGYFGTPPPSDDPPRDLADPAVQRQLEPRELADAIRHGASGMPALEAPPAEADVVPLSAFIRLLSPALPTYTTFCEGCHGFEGRGIDLPSMLHPPETAFDAEWLATTTRAERATAVRHMLDARKPQMAHYRGLLPERSVRAIVDWLRRH